MSGWALKLTEKAENRRKEFPDDIELEIFRALDLICKDPEEAANDVENGIHYYEGDESPQIHINYRVDHDLRQVTVHYVGCTIIIKKEIAISVFLSYSRDDEVWFKKLREELKPLKKLDIHIWSDKEIEAGEKWLDLIQEKVLDQSACLLLVSEAFLKSNFISKHELPIFLKRAEKQNPDDKPFLLLWLPMADMASIEQHELGYEVSQYQTFEKLKKPLNKLWPWQVPNTLRMIREDVSHAIHHKFRKV